MAKKLLTSPKGTAVYPHLNKPDVKYKPEGEYHIRLAVPVSDPKAVALMKLIDDGIAVSVATARKENPAKAKKINACSDKSYSMEKDDDDNETGNVLFSFKMKASGKSRKTGEEFTQRPALFDATGNPLSQDTKVGGGSVVRVSFELLEFFQNTKIGAGVTLRLKGVQVIKLVEWGSGDAAYHGFEAEEAEDEDAETPESEEDEEEEEQPKAKKSNAKTPAAAKDEDEDEDEEEEF